MWVAAGASVHLAARARFACGYCQRLVDDWEQVESFAFMASFVSCFGASDHECMAKLAVQNECRVDVEGLLCACG